MEVSDLLKIMDDYDKDRLYEKIHEERLAKTAEDRKKAREITTIEIVGKYIYLHDKTSTRTGFINTEVYSLSRVFEFLENHNYANNIELDNSFESPLKKLIDIFMWSLHYKTSFHAEVKDGNSKTTISYFKSVKPV